MMGVGVGCGSRQEGGSLKQWQVLFVSYYVTSWPNEHVPVISVIMSIHCFIHGHK